MGSARVNPRHFPGRNHEHTPNNDGQQERERANLLTAMNELVRKVKRRISSVDSSSLSHDVASPAHEEIEPASPTNTPVVKSTKQFCSTGSSIPYTCSLPPICNHKPARFHSPGELESHHRTHHAFTCSSADCQRIFPSQYFLDLHFNEVHNPLLLVQRENRQTKIFRCFEPICEKSFSSPKTRRLHLIDMHGYPRTFFFSLPNQGLNDLYKKFGPGVSLIRPDWKPSNGRCDAPSKLPVSDANACEIGVPNATTTPRHESESIADRIENPDRNKPQGDDNMEGIDSVIDSVQQLSLVPRQIQFGKKAGSKSFQR